MNVKDKLIEWYEKYCYKHKISSDLFDINAEIDSNISYDENINILEEKLNKLTEVDDNLKEKFKANKTAIELDSIKKEDKYLNWIKKTSSKSLIMIVIGKRGSGKTALGFHLLELHKSFSDRPLFIYKFPRANVLPKWIKPIDDIEKADNDGVVLIDEASMEFSQFSFNSDKSQSLSNLMKIARHKGITLIFIAQNSSFLTRDIRRLVDVYLLKEPSLVQMYDEVSIIKRLYQNCFMLFSTETAKKKGYFVADGNVMDLFYFDLPNFWNDKISKAFGTKQEVFNSSKLIESLKYPITPKKSKKKVKNENIRV